METPLQARRLAKIKCCITLDSGGCESHLLVCVEIGETFLEDTIFQIENTSLEPEIQALFLECIS